MERRESRLRQIRLHEPLFASALELWKWVERTWNGLRKNKSRHSPQEIQSNLETLGALLSRMDYGSGQLNLARAVREVVAQKVVEEGLSQHLNGRTWDDDGGILPGTVETYFIIRLPWQVRSAGWEFPAAILGRRVVPRFGAWSDFDTIRAWHRFLIRALGIWDMYGSPQTAGFSQLTDFENITWDRLEDLRPKDGLLETPLDSWANTLASEAARTPAQNTIDQKVMTLKAEVLVDPRFRNARRESLRFVPRSTWMYQLFNALLAGDISDRAFRLYADALLSRGPCPHDFIMAALMSARRRPQRVVDTILAFHSAYRDQRVPALIHKDADGTRWFMDEIMWMPNLFALLYWAVLPKSPESAAKLIRGNAVVEWTEELRTRVAELASRLNSGAELLAYTARPFHDLMTALVQIHDPKFMPVAVAADPRVGFLFNAMASAPLTARVTREPGVSHGIEKNDHPENALEKWFSAADLRDFSGSARHLAQFQEGFRKLVAGRFPWTVWQEGRGLAKGEHPCERIFELPGWE